MTTSHWLQLFFDLQEDQHLKRWSWFLDQALLTAIGRARRYLPLPEVCNDN